MNLETAIREALARQHERETAAARQQEVDEAARVRQIKADFALHVREDFGVGLLTDVDAIVEMGSNLTARATWTYRGGSYALGYQAPRDVREWSVSRLAGPSTESKALPVIHDQAQMTDALLCALGELAGETDEIPF
jgi:hypothetical protein